MKINIKIGNEIKEIEANNYLKDRTDEYTGELIGKRLDRTIRIAWFKAENPEGVINKTLKSSGIPLDMIKSDCITAEAIKFITETAGVAIASVEIFKDGNDDFPIANDYAVRVATESFAYNCEAAINAATDRALISAGYFVPEELCYNKITGYNNAPTTVVSQPNTVKSNTVSIYDSCDSSETTDITNSNITSSAVADSLAALESSMEKEDTSLYQKIWNAENNSTPDIVSSVTTEPQTESVNGSIYEPVEKNSDVTSEVPVAEDVETSKSTSSPYPVVPSPKKNMKLMSFEELMQNMSYEEACNVAIPSGKFKGKTMLEMYNLDSKKVGFYIKNTVSDYLKAAAMIVSEGLNK